jgi:hypothetical protein
MTTTERLCIACERRPLPKDGSRERCRPCEQRFQAEQQDAVEEAIQRKTRKKWSDPLNLCRYVRVYRWKYHLVGYTCGTTDDGRTYCQPGFFYLDAGPSEESLAKFGGKLVDMNVYQPNLDAPWVKRFKVMLKAVDNEPGLVVGTRLNWDGCL